MFWLATKYHEDKIERQTERAMSSNVGNTNGGNLQLFRQYTSFAAHSSKLFWAFMGVLLLKQN